MIKLDKGELGHGELHALKHKGVKGVLGDLSSGSIGGDSLVIAPRPQHKIISQTHKTPGTQVVHHNKETGKVSYAKAPDDFHTTHQHVVTKHDLNYLNGSSTTLNGGIDISPSSKVLAEDKLRQIFVVDNPENKEAEKIAKSPASYIQEIVNTKQEEAKEILKIKEAEAQKEIDRVVAIKKEADKKKADAEKAKKDAKAEGKPEPGKDGDKAKAGGEEEKKGEEGKKPDAAADKAKGADADKGKDKKGADAAGDNPTANIAKLADKAKKEVGGDKGDKGGDDKKKAEGGADSASGGDKKKK